MSPVTLLRRPDRSAPWEPLPLAGLDPVAAAENDEVWLRLRPDPGEAARLKLGSIVVASSRSGDKVLLIREEFGAADEPALGIAGRFFEDWAGLTELSVELKAEGGDWRQIVAIPVAVSAGKLSQELFERLFREVEREAAAVLLDVHGKTLAGLTNAPAPAPSSPIAVLRRVRETVREMGDLLPRVARNPASRLRPRVSREAAVPGQAVSEATLEAARLDPGLLGRRGGGVAFREQLRETSRPDYRLPEHQSIADFAEGLKAQLADLRRRIDAEVVERRERKRWRGVVKDGDRQTWWEAEDQPRIEELERCRTELAPLGAAIDGWLALPFLPPGRPGRGRPESTPLFRNGAAYRGVFQVMAGHSSAYRLTLDAAGPLARVRSLPDLYEAWCSIRLLRLLSDKLLPEGGEGFARLAQAGGGFTVGFAPDQRIGLRDRRGTRVVFRYQPSYPPAWKAPGPACVLNGNSPLTPDLAVEVFRDGGTTPDCIMVFDAKYSRTPHRARVADVAKYGRIGDARTGRILSRQVWAMMPGGPERPGHPDGLRGHASGDNAAFWGDGFDAQSPCVGAVRVVPVPQGGYDPLADLLGRLMTLAGVAWER